MKPLLASLRPYPAHTLLLVATIVFDALFDSLVPVALSLLVDQATATKNLGLALALGGALAGGWLVSVGSQLTRDWLYAWITTAVLTDLRVKVVAHLHERPYARLRELKPSDVGGALGTELARIENLLLNVLPSFLFAGLYLVFSLTAMVGTDLRLAAFVAVLLPFAAVGPRLLGAKASSRGAVTRQEETDLGSVALEQFQAQPMLRTFDLSQRFRQAFWARARQLRDKAKRFYWLTNVTRRAPNLTMQFTHLGLMLLGLFLLWQGQLGVGAFLAFNLLFLNISSSVLDLSSTYGGWLAAGLAFARLAPFVTPASPAAPSAAPPPFEDTGPVDLEFRGVWFEYDASKAILSDVSFRLAAGKRTAIVGPSGAGKSTLAALLSGLYLPNRGSILWNGKDLDESGRKAAKARLGAVFQENTILNASLAENIRLGGAGGDEGLAIRDAGLQAWVNDLPQGLDTPAGEGGGFLSGGQKQRLALARALYRRPGLLILDEATSALDPLSEALVNDTLRALAGSTTIVHITHRLEGVRDYDSIVVLEKGRVAEIGTHDELLAKKGLYAGLWSKQSGVQVTDGQTARITPEALAGIPLFAGSRPATLANLARSFTSEAVAPGQAVIRQGTPGSRFFVVARGRVDVVIAAHSQETVVATLEDGDFFGEMSLLDTALTSATVVARIPTLVLALEKSTFQTLIAADPEVAERVRQTAQKRKDENAKR